MKKPLLTALSVCLLLLVWQFAAWQIQNANLFPPVSLLLRTLGELLLSPSFYQAVWTTVWRGCAGLLLSLLAAIGTAVLLRRSEAMQLLMEIKSDFPAAFIVKENINYPVIDKENAFSVDTVKVLRPLDTEAVKL